MYKSSLDRLIIDITLYFYRRKKESTNYKNRNVETSHIKIKISDIQYASLPVRALVNHTAALTDPIGYKNPARRAGITT